MRIAINGNIWTRWANITQGLTRAHWRLGPDWRLVKFLPTTESCPYLRVYLHCTQVLVHRIVLETFIGPCPMNLEACHRNGNCLDNRLGNLRWGTRSSNIRDQRRHGTHGRNAGARNGRAAFTEEEVREIRQEALQGKTYQQIAAERQEIPQTIARIIWRQRYASVKD